MTDRLATAVGVYVCCVVLGYCLTAVGIAAWFG